MIDAGCLRKDLIDFFETKKVDKKLADVDIVQVKNADLYGLIEIAEIVGLDLEDYVVVYDGD